MAACALRNEKAGSVWQELDYRIDICRVTKGAHIEQLYGWTKTWRDSLSIDMLLSAVSVLVVAQSIFEILEGFMNNPLYCHGFPLGPEALYSN